MTVKKISFLMADSSELFSALHLLSEAERENAEEIIESYLSYDSDLFFGFAFVLGTLTVRIFDGAEYTFSFPYEISEKADLPGAVQEVVRYAVLEEIEPIFEGVPREMAECFFRLGYRHINADSDSPDSQTYRITLKNECSFFDECPKAVLSDIELSPISDEDASDYARLSRDALNNKYWGYDYREDYGNASDGLFLGLARRDFELNSTVSLAIRAAGKFIGEALISSFDYRGGADISVRILPEYQNKGYARRALVLLFEIAQKMGLVTLYARVYKENLPSISLFSKEADEMLEEEEAAVFVYNLY